MALDRQSIEKKDFPLGRADTTRRPSTPTSPPSPTRSRDRTRHAGAVTPGLVGRRPGADDRRGRRESAAEIQRGAEEDAREIRQEASQRGRATRENAQREAREHVDRVTEATNAMLQRVNAMDQELDALIESVRAGSNRLSADLRQLEVGLGNVGRDRAAARLRPDEPAPATARRPPPAARPATAHGDRGPALARGAASRSSPEPPSPAEERRRRPAARGGRAAERRPGCGSATARTSPARPAGDDTEGASLIALNMALNGTPRRRRTRT